MNYKIPQTEIMKLVVRAAVAEKKEIESMRLLGSEVNKKLKLIDENYRASEERCKEIALETVKVRTIVGKKIYAGKECPVCKKKITSIKNRTINGNSATVGYHCPNCGYTSPRYLKVPARYIFTL